MNWWLRFGKVKVNDWREWQAKGEESKLKFGPTRTIFSDIGFIWVRQLRYKVHTWGSLFSPLSVFSRLAICHSRYLIDNRRVASVMFHAFHPTLLLFWDVLNWRYIFSHFSSSQHDGHSSHLTKLATSSFHPDHQDNPASRLTWKGLRGSISFCHPPKFTYNDSSRSPYSSPTVYQASNTCSHSMQIVYEATRTRIRSSAIANVTMHLPSCIRGSQKRDWVSSSR